MDNSAPVTPEPAAPVPQTPLPPPSMQDMPPAGGPPSDMVPGKMKPIIPIAIAVILLVVLGGGVLMYKYMLMNQEPKTPQPLRIIEDTTPTVTPASSEAELSGPTPTPIQDLDNVDIEINLLDKVASETSQTDVGDSNVPTTQQ